MSDVSPSDGGYRIYSRSIDELAQDAQTEAKRARERERIATERLEENYKNEIRKRDEALETATQNLRDETSKALARERESSRDEMANFKRQTYDRFGKIYAHDIEGMHQQMQEHLASDEVKDKQSKLNNLQAENAHQAQLEEQAKAQAEKLETVAKEIHDTSLSSHDQTIQNEKDEAVRKDKAREETLQRQLQDLAMDRQLVRRAATDAATSLEYSRKKNQETENRRNDRIQSTSSKNIEESIRKINESHAQEVQDLRDQIRYLANDRTHQQGLAEGRAEAIKSYEDEWRSKTGSIIDGYERQIQTLNTKEAENTAHLTQKSGETLREKDAYLATLIAKQTADNRLTQKQTEDTFMSNQDQLEKRMRRDREQAENNLTLQLSNASQEQEHALENQAKNYNDLLHRQRLSSQEQMEQLQKTIEERFNSADLSNISPAVEQALRRNLEKNYQKIFQAEDARYEDKTDSILNEYSRRLRDTVTEKDSATTQFFRQSEAQHHSEKDQLMDQLQEAEASKAATQRDHEASMDRTLEMLSRRNANALEEQRRHFDEAYSASRDEALAKNAGMRNEAEFNAKMQQRAFAVRENELVRDYQKKLADQKVDYEELISQMKSESNQSLRDAERKHKQANEEQAHYYEQRLAELAFQSKEKERALTQSYEDELEKMRRANALLVKKKS